MDTKYTAIYAKIITGYSAHIPDLPGCIATGRTPPEGNRNLTSSRIGRCHSAQMASAHGSSVSMSRYECAKESDQTSPCHPAG